MRGAANAQVWQSELQNVASFIELDAAAWIFSAQSNWKHIPGTAILLKSTN
jgi:hypothetical protein